MKQPELAELASVGLSTVVDFEKSRRVVAQQSIDAISSALRSAGILFIAANGGGAGVRFRDPDPDSGLMG